MKIRPIAALRGRGGGGKAVDLSETEFLLSLVFMILSLEINNNREGK